MLSRQHDLGFTHLQNNMFSSVINMVKSYYNIIKISYFIQSSLCSQFIFISIKLKKKNSFLALFVG